MPRSYFSTERPRAITTAQLVVLGWKLCCDPKGGIFGYIQSKIAPVPNVIYFSRNRNIYPLPNIR